MTSDIQSEASVRAGDDRGAGLTDGGALVRVLEQIVGPANVITGARRTRRFCTGFRFGRGSVVAVVRPGSLVEQWRVLQAVVAAKMIVIMQAANTGLTGGSTPDGEYDRGVILINTMRLAGIHVINQGQQVVCLPGATLYQLENILRPIGRDPHSVIGSSCIGASVFGGVCNNSGGALVHRGPAFTQLALFARLDESGVLCLINHLGIDLGGDPETILENVERGNFTQADIVNDQDKLASDQDYSIHVRDITSPIPARFNADPRRLFEASGSAGKIVLMAVRLDTFPKTERSAVFYVGSNDPSELRSIRRHMLARFRALPISAEYLHRGAFDIAEKYGKDMFLAINYLGTAWLPHLFAIKSWVDGIASRFPVLPAHLSDRIMQAVSALFPRHLPRRIGDYRGRFEHHLILQMADDGIEEAACYLKSIFPSRTGDFFRCEGDEGAKALLHRFAAAGAAVRYRAMHEREVEDIVALDIALRRNDEQWCEELPPEIDAKLLHKLYYGHFFCHVFHQDYIVAKGNDCQAIEEQMCELLDGRGAEYPAEHNVGHLYHATPALVEHYRSLDPCNAFNPGIGRTTKRLNWNGDRKGEGTDSQNLRQSAS